MSDRVDRDRLDPRRRRTGAESFEGWERDQSSRCVSSNIRMLTDPPSPQSMVIDTPKNTPSELLKACRRHWENELDWK